MESIDVEETEDDTTKVYLVELLERIVLSIAPIPIDRHNSENVAHLWANYSQNDIGNKKYFLNYTKKNTRTRLIKFCFRDFISGDKIVIKVWEIY